MLEFSDLSIGYQFPQGYPLYLYAADSGTHAFKTYSEFSGSPVDADHMNVNRSMVTMANGKITSAKPSPKIGSGTDLSKTFAAQSQLVDGGASTRAVEAVDAVVARGLRAEIMGKTSVSASAKL